VSIEFYWVAVVATTVLSVARLARLLVIDKWPPVKKVRDWYETKTDGSDWQWLTMCAFCMAPWCAVWVLAWGLLAGVYPLDYPASEFWAQAWWVFNGWLAVSYLAGTYVARDGSGAEGV
jgi:hypothetical protein